MPQIDPEPQIDDAELDAWLAKVNAVEIPPWKMVSEERKVARAKFEADRLKRLRLRINALARSRQTPWYQRWVRRIDRNKYFAGGGLRGVV